MAKRLLLLILAFLPLCVNAQTVEVVRDEGGRVTASVHKVYDNRDCLAVQIEYAYDTAGVVETRTLRQFDKQGREERMEVLSADEVLLFAQTRQYDRKGRLHKIVQITYEDDGSVQKDCFKYEYKSSDTIVYLNGKIISK